MESFSNDVLFVKKAFTFCGFLVALSSLGLRFLEERVSSSDFSVVASFSFVTGSLSFLIGVSFLDSLFSFSFLVFAEGFFGVLLARFLLPINHER